MLALGSPRGRPAGQGLNLRVPLIGTPPGASLHASHVVAPPGVVLIQHFNFSEHLV